MRHPAPLLIALLLLALAGWARSDDGDADLRAQVHALESRLAALEAGHPAPSGTLRVRDLVIEDAEGRERIRLDVRQHLGPRLVMRDAEGMQRASLDVGGLGDAGLHLFDRRGGYRLSVELNHGDAPYISMRGARPDPRQLLIEVPNEGEVGLGLWGGPGAQGETSHAGLYIWQDGTIAFGGGLRSAGRTGFILKYPREADPSLEVRDRDEHVIWRLPAPE